MHLHVHTIFILEEQFEKEFSDKEKAKLYEAIGYQENEVDPALPREVSVDRYQTDTDIKQISEMCTVKSALFMVALSSWVLGILLIHE